jgi:biofilm PGA synthesis N-glycosyltransferase PgaC
VLTYVIITPARNEVTTIEGTIRSVVQQTRPPLAWVIVSDGSTDGTDEIVKRYLPAHPWMQLVSLPDRKARHFAGKVQAFNAGFAKVRDLPYDIICNLDADITFGQDHFAFLLERFAKDDRLGVTGTPFREGTAQYDYHFTSIDHVSGACQLFRRSCFTGIGGYRPIRTGGVDLVAVITARMQGWKTRTFTERVCFHHRRIGTAKDRYLAARFKVGRQDYMLGGHPLWEVFRAVYQMKNRPYVIGGAMLYLGYVWAWVRGTKRPVPQELVAFRRKEQMQRLRRLFLLEGQAGEASALPEQRTEGTDAGKVMHWPLSRIAGRLRGIVNARVLKRWGAPATKRSIWDDEFTRGQWDYLEHTADDPIYHYLDRYCDHGSILDLGCGSGNTGCEMEPSRYGQYTGVDISEQAVQRARTRSMSDQRHEKNEYVCADISRYEPRQRYDVILFRESLFYVPRPQIVALLERYRSWLTERGVFIVRMCDRKRYHGIVRRIEQNYCIVDSSPAVDANIILVFR